MHANKNTKVFFQSSEHIHNKVDGPYFKVSAKKSLISDPDSGKPEENKLQFCAFQIGSWFPLHSYFDECQKKKIKLFLK